MATEPSPADREQRRKRGMTRMIALAMQLPFTVLAGYLAGTFLDDYFETTYLGTTVLILAIVGAFAQLIHEVLKNAADADADLPSPGPAAPPKKGEPR